MGLHGSCADASHHGGAAVLLVVGVKYEQDVNSPLQDLIRPVFGVGQRMEHHVEEVALEPLELRHLFLRTNLRDIGARQATCRK